MRARSVGYCPTASAMPRGAGALEALGEQRVAVGAVGLDHADVVAGAQIVVHAPQASSARARRASRRGGRRARSRSPSSRAVRRPAAAARSTPADRRVRRCPRANPRAASPSSAAAPRARPAPAAERCRVGSGDRASGAPLCSTGFQPRCRRRSRDRGAPSRGRRRRPRPSRSTIALIELGAPSRSTAIRVAGVVSSSAMPASRSARCSRGVVSHRCERSRSRAGTARAWRSRDRGSTCRPTIPPGRRGRRRA